MSTRTTSVHETRDIILSPEFWEAPCSVRVVFNWGLASDQPKTGVTLAHQDFIDLAEECDRLEKELEVYQSRVECNSKIIVDLLEELT